MEEDSSIDKARHDGDKWINKPTPVNASAKERFEEKVTRTIDGNEVTRDASHDDPAFLIEQEDGSRVLKSQSELKQA